MSLKLQQWRLLYNYFELANLSISGRVAPAYLFVLLFGVKTGISASSLGN